MGDGGVRISITGTSGSGKTTVGRAAAERLGVHFLELDSLRHQPGWRELPDDEFRARVLAFVEEHESWVIDGNYRVVSQDIVRARATTIAWLDLPKSQVMAQITWRSLRRAALRTELWNGNRESWRNLVNRDPLQNIVLWAWTSHERRRRDNTEAMAGDPRWVRLTSRRAARRWVDSLAL